MSFIFNNIRYKMLQNLLRKVLSSKQPKSSVEINVNPDTSLKKWQSYQRLHQTCDDDEILLRHEKRKIQSENGTNHRKRIVSCPDARDLQLLCNTMDIALVDLKRICEKGEDFLQDEEYSLLSSEIEDNSSVETDKEEEIGGDDGSGEACGSSKTLEDLR